MYGLVNKAIEDLVTKEHGDEVWAQIVAAAGLETVGFISMDPYPDAVTYGLVGAASEVLGVPAPDLLEAFGKYWVLYTAREGYGELLDLSGRTFAEFMANLDNLHTRVGLTMPELQPPAFRCEEGADGKLRLHYYSERDGLAPMVAGLIKGLADRYSVQVEVQHEVRRGEGCDHDVFAVALTEA